jgi:hypothetical protein
VEPSGCRRRPSLVEGAPPIRRGREELRGRPCDSEERQDARGGFGERRGGGGFLLLVDLVEERLDLAAQERLAGPGGAAGPGAGLGGGRGRDLVVEDPRSEADNG